MKTTFNYIFCFAICSFLMSAQISPCYNFFFDLAIELQETNEENPVEDTCDTELEEEKEMRNNDLFLRFLLENSSKSLLDHEFNLQSPDKDILSPPPDFV